MQPISNEPISIIAIIIIITTLVYSYFRYNKDEKKGASVSEKISMVAEVEENKNENPVIAAIVAMMMEQRPFKIKNIVIGKGEEVSMWRQSGRQEIMRRRSTMQR
jgi:predicted permease